MGHKKESHDHDERRKCRRQSNSASTKRARKNRSHSLSISVGSKAHGKRRYYQSSSESWSESLSHSSSESSLESSESLSWCPSPQNKNRSGSKQDYASFKQTGYHWSKSHSPVNKNEKNIHQSKHGKKTPQNKLRSRSTDEYRRRQEQSRHYKWSCSQSVKSLFDYHDRESCKQSRSRSPERKDTTEVGHNLWTAHLTIMLKNSVNDQDWDHKKGKDTREVGHALSKPIWLWCWKMSQTIKIKFIRKEMIQ